MQAVVYISNAVDDIVRFDRAIKTDSPAATNKVVAISKAINLSGAKSIILSLGRGRQNGSWLFHSATTKKISDVEIYYAAFLHARFFTHIVSAFSLVLILFKLRFKYKNLSAIVYNRCYHYLPAILLAKVLLIPCYLDLEDGYNNDSGSVIIGCKNFFTRLIFSGLCAHRAMVSTSYLINQVNDSRPYICYGVADDIGLPQSDWSSNRLQIIFSGTLLEEVGSKFLLEAIDILREDHPIELKKIFFVITGKGPCSDLFEEYAQSYPQILSFQKSLPKQEYLALLRASHIGLSLRLSAYSMGGTTFPSKVIEYANNGLAVLSTKTSDVPLLFEEDAIYLSNETPGALAKLIATLPGKKNELHNVSLLGMKKVREKCSPDLVGESVIGLVSSNV